MMMDDDFDSLTPEQVRQELIERLTGRHADPEQRETVVKQLVFIDPRLQEQSLKDETLLRAKIDENFNELVSQWNDCYDEVAQPNYHPKDGPTARRHALRTLDHALAEALGKDGLLTPPPEDTFRDGDRSISVWKDGHCIGFSGVSFGLRRYYTRLDCDNVTQGMDKELRGHYKNALNASRGKFIITQMQATRGTQTDRKEVKFRRILMDAWKKVNTSLPEGINLFLPGELTYWNLPGVMMARNEKAQDEGHKVNHPTKTVLDINYDHLAPRHGFRYNPDIALFERKIKN
jgi:hypothetical protein